MFAALAPALISGGASLLSGIYGANQSSKAARLNAIAQANEAERAREYNAAEAEKAYQRNRADYLVDVAREHQLQKDFAQMGIQWRAADAKAAGIHPLAALGAQLTSYSPQSVGGGSYEAQKMPRYSPTPASGANPLAGLPALGQDISRAITANQREDQRMEAYNATAMGLNTQRMGLENELLATQIAKLRAPGTPPAFPSIRSSGKGMPGQGDDPFVKDEALKRTIMGSRGQEPAPVADIGFTQTQSGHAPVYSKDAKERLEDDEGGMLAWNLRNRIMPMFGINYNIPGGGKQGEGGKYYWYNPFTQEYVTSAKQRDYSPSRARGYSNYMRTN